MVKTLRLLSWLRDIGIVVLFLAGNQIRHSEFGVGLTIQLFATVVFLERFVWYWNLCELREAQNRLDREQ